jgi:hypothetical protein
MVAAYPACGYQSRMPTTAERVAAAARATLGAGSARMWECRFVEPAGPPERSSTQYSEGVADLANVRAEIRVREAPMWSYFADLILERFPWLDDGEDGDEELEPTMVYAGTAGFIGNEGTWMPLGLRTGDPHAGRRMPEDPLWILEALTIVADAAPRGAERVTVRDVACAPLRFEVDLRRAGGRIEVIEARGRSPRLLGDVWIDEDERIRRVTWQRPIVQRPRSPLKQPRVIAWRTLELWDFGTPVHIEVPVPMKPKPKRLLVHDLYDGLGWLWRRKRAYERRQLSAAPPRAARRARRA